MENPELKHYIDAQLAGGTAPDELKKLLVHHGWDPAIVDAHLPPKGLATPPLVTVVHAGAADGGAYVDDRKKRKWAIFFLVLPFALMILILSVYAINSFVVSAALSKPQAPAAESTGAIPSLGSAPALGEATGLSLSTATGLGQYDKRATAARIVNVALGLLGLLAFLSIFICLPIGIVLLIRSRRTLKPGVAYDERSGKGEASIIPPELGHWNWGAAFLTVWWGLYYRVWIAFLVFVPFIGQFWWVVMGIKGNEWAWQKNQWLSVDEFKKTQKKWAVWAIVLLIFSFLIGLATATLIVIGAAKMHNSSPSAFRFDTGSSFGSGATSLKFPKDALMGPEFMSATYVIDGQPIALRYGSASTPIAGSEKNIFMQTGYFGKASYGDLNGDGKQDVAVILTQEPGGSGTFYYLAAALKAADGTATGTNALLLGDRIIPRSTAVDGDMVTVKYLDRQTGEPMSAAPAVAMTRFFKFANGQLSEIK